MTAERARPAMRAINKDLPIPYYYQIAQRLREWIDGASAGQTETALPSEAELCAAFEVTRGTARHALELLEREGLIYRQKGRGSFVSRRRVQVELTKLVSTTEDMLARGWTPSTRLLHLAVVSTTTHAQRRLGLTEGQPVWEIVRLRLANGEPISLQTGYVPQSRTPGLDKFDLTHSLYYILKNHYDIELRSADQTIRARGATADEAALLEIAEHDPVFEVIRTSYDQQHTPAEHLDSVWRGDRYDFQVHLSAS